MNEVGDIDYRREALVLRNLQEKGGRRSRMQNLDRILMQKVVEWI